MRAILHIGTEKTGTTSFQNFCFENRAALLQQKILYPVDLGPKNHRQIATYALDAESRDESFEQLGLLGQDDLDTFCQKVRDKLSRQIEENSTAEVCIISTEHLHSRLKTTAQIQRVKDLLDIYFDEIEVHLHLRPQIDVVVSLASTQTRVGGSVRRPFLDRPHSSDIYYNYNILTKAWESIFGPENIKLLSFQRCPDFQSFIAGHLDIDLTVMAAAERINEAIDVRVMALVNALVDSESKQRLDHRIIDRLAVNEKLTVDLKTAKIVQNRFSACNQELIARRDDLVAGDLMPKWSKYPEQGNLDILSQPCEFSSALADLVTYYNEIIAEK